LTVINGALQNENNTLRHDQSAAGRQPATEAELHELQEEFTRRIAAADRTIASLKVSWNVLPMPLQIVSLPAAKCMQNGRLVWIHM
jgi:hypothetical protein